MSYYPILSAPYCTGRTTLYNFPPNSWEPIDKCDQFVSLTYIKDGLWYSKTIDKLKYQEYKVINYSDIIDLKSDSALGLLSLSKEELPEKSRELPDTNCNHTSTPAYRATLSLQSKFSETCYQGEVDPFSPKGSMLTFSPFMQFGNNIENYFLLINLEKKAENRAVEVKIYDANTKDLKKIQSASSNQISVISLDGIGFDEASLPVIICRDMASIPLYFSTYKQGELLSLEHSHPPASLVLHGNRFGALKQVKDYWFSQLKKNVE